MAPGHGSSAAVRNFQLSQVKNFINYLYFGYGNQNYSMQEKKGKEISIFMFRENITNSQSGFC
jgi:hypothetical protein